MDGKQHLQLGDKMSADGVKKMLDASGVGKGAARKGKSKKSEKAKAEPGEATEAHPKHENIPHTTETVHLTAQVVPETPLGKAQTLLTSVLREANSCRILDCENPSPDFISDHLII